MREKKMAILSDIENNIDVYSLKYKFIDIWPILKTSLFFFNHKNSDTKIERVFYIKFLKKIWKLLYLDFLYSFILRVKLLNSLKRVDYLFAGYYAHRTFYDQKSMNKFFDPIMDFLENEMAAKTIAFEHDFSPIQKQYYKKERVLNVSRLIPYYRIKANNGGFESDILYNVIDVYSKKTNADKDSLKEKINFDLNEIFFWKNLWSDILDRTNPKVVFMLCYYNPKLFGLTLAANEKNICTIDMQHGGQGKYQPCYSFSNYKKMNSLPNVFWVWDSTTKLSLENIFKKNEQKIVIGGNPWIDFLNKNNDDSLPEKRKIILHSLQPGLDIILAKPIIESIKSTDKHYVWYLRLHPRMTKRELNIVKELVVANNLQHMVEIDLATSLPLPLILRNTFALVSYYSGVLIEAHLCGVQINIVIDLLGAQTYSEYLEGGKMEYLDLNLDYNYYNEIKRIESKKDYLNKLTVANQDHLPNLVELFKSL
jgi:hypothetical protein